MATGIVAHESAGLLKTATHRFSSSRSPDARLHEQVAAALETDAGLQERLERVALPVQAVHDVRAWRAVSTGHRTDVRTWTYQA